MAGPTRWAAAASSIGHRAIGLDLPYGFLTDLGQSLQKTLPAAWLRPNPPIILKSSVILTDGNS